MSRSIYLHHFCDPSRPTRRYRVHRLSQPADYHRVVLLVPP